MRRLLFLTLLVSSLTSAPALADQILFLSPNTGSGDNFAYITPSLRLGGGTDFLFFGDIGYPGGLTVGGGGGLFLNSTFVDIDGTPLEFFFSQGTISMTSFTLPTNGRDVIVPEDISFSASGFNFDTQQTISVSGGARGWVGTRFSNGLYYPGDFVEGPLPPVATPEPGTLGLIGTGLMSIAALARKRRGLTAAASGSNPLAPTNSPFFQPV